MPKVTFIHTADLHLEERKPDRLQVLTWILEKAKSCSAAVIISGDLFNSDKDADLLFETVRSIFLSFNETLVFVIPGNYDKNSFNENMDYGDNVIVLNKSPFAEINFKGIKLIGIPNETNQALKQAINSIKSTDITILIIHGTYFDDSVSYIRDEIKKRGEEYFPVYLEDVKDENFIYIAMGHIHSNVTIQNNKARKIGYPGSPVSIDETDVGPRKVVKVVVDTDTRNLVVTEQIVNIGIFKLRKEFYVYPGKERISMMNAVQYLHKNADRRADIKLELKGYIKVSNERLDKLINAIKLKYNNRVSCLNIINNTINYKQLMNEQTLISEFISRLDSYETSDVIKNRAIELGLKAFESEFK